MSRRRVALRVLAGLGGLVVVGAVAGYWYERPLLLTGTGYAAHNACAVQFISERHDDPQSDLPPNPLVPYLRTATDSGDKSAKTSILGVLASQRAWYTPGFGCTLAKERPDLGSTTEIPAGRNPLLTATPAAAQPAVTDAIAKAFGDDLPDAERKALGTRAVVVLRHGEIVGERYADGFTPTTAQLGWSMAKSVTNLLVGTLVQEGKVKVTDDHLRPEWTDDRAKITVDDLMRMTSGLAWDETYSLGTPITKMLYNEPDMAAFVASQKLAHPVGTVQQYSSGSTNLLCSVLTERAGVKADLPGQRILAPLGLTGSVWEPDAAGTPVCSSYLWATPRAWAALGQFALDDGVVDGKQLLPEGWIKESTTAKPVGETDEPGYAAGWRVNKGADGTVIEPSLPADTFWMTGHDGQRVYVVPSADLVVVRLGFSPGIEPKDLRDIGLVKTLSALP
jgi:CubicO group peptidase (beta-lactamase class C family)